MNLIVKFNLVLAGTVAVGLLVTAVVAHRMLNDEARAQALDKGRLMMDAANATRMYTSTHIKPLLETQLKYEFVPESVPAFSAIQLLGGFLKRNESNYDYKEVALNPTNPRDRASESETVIVNRFRKDEKIDELVSENDTPTGRVLYLARPIRITDGKCLQCHSTVEAAPKTMVDKYGRNNGFGWQMNETVGAQIVTVPGAEQSEHATAAFRTFMISIAAVFGLVFVVLNAMLTLLVIRPVTRLAMLAEKVSLDGDATTRFDTSGNDEIAALTRAFDRMRTSLTKAMTMIDD